MHNILILTQILASIPLLVFLFVHVGICIHQSLVFPSLLFNFQSTRLNEIPSFKKADLNRNVYFILKVIMIAAQHF